MKMEFQLRGSEIRIACRNYIKEKYPDIEIDWHDLFHTSNGSTTDRTQVMDDTILYVVSTKE